MEDFIEILETTDRIPIFVDLNNLLYRNYFVYSPDKFVSKKGLPNGHLFGLCQGLRTMDKLGYEIFLCEDSKCEWRQQLNEDYKAQRESKGFHKDYPLIRDLISNLDHAHSLQAKGFEADDIMYSAANICSNKNIKCYIFSTDKDLMQALNENISIVHKITLSGNEEVSYNSDYYNEKFPVEPKKLPYYRAFKGDTSDNLPIPVKRMPKDLLLDLVDYISEHKGLAGYNIKKESHRKWIKLLIENWDTYLTNYKLMKLNNIQFLVLPKSKKDSYISVCEDYELYQYQDYIRELFLGGN